MELRDTCFKTPNLNIFKDLKDEHNEERNGIYQKEPSEYTELRKHCIALQYIGSGKKIKKTQTTRKYL